MIQAQAPERKTATSGVPSPSKSAAGDGRVTPNPASDRKPQASATAML